MAGYMPGMMPGMMPYMPGMVPGMMPYYPGAVDPAAADKAKVRFISIHYCLVCVSNWEFLYTGCTKEFSFSEY